MKPERIVAAAKSTICAASLALLLLGSISGCIGLPGTPGSPSGAPGSDNPHCVAHCHARIVQGCGGDESGCLLACNISYSISSSEGKCQQAYLDEEDCRNDPALLALGCSPPQNKLDDACRAQIDALTACEKARDGR